MSGISRIAIGQLCSSSCLSRNLQTVKYLIGKAVDKNVRLIFFPEATDYIARNAIHSQQLAAKSPRFVEELRTEIRELCDRKSKKIDVAIGVHLPPSESEVVRGEQRVKNVLLYINYRGEVVQSYQKLHLFDVDVPNGPVMKESNSVQPGSKVAEIVETPVGKLGLEICYDIRFPEQSLELRSKGAEILCFPSAFTMKTGEAHWELLGRARAVDTQCFVVMPAQSGKHDTGSGADASQDHVERISWGHSMVIDPWGRIIAQSSLSNDCSSEELIIADLDYTILEKVRVDMPLWEQRSAASRATDQQLFTF
ncbi:hypothetical protein HG537_0A08080 [Torulaspora globosa]|uniref:CN hydrolase domain-containing protein n=1 Tax=Torulaspora globosa TaxID=48254 RepID=A0A7H9HMY8_9SACH|nr:hypothetical protein HG537_0A08080 [Torulaspora sp. CBS 2947]